MPPALALRLNGMLRSNHITLRVEFRSFNPTWPSSKVSGIGTRDGVKCRSVDQLTCSVAIDFQAFMTQVDGYGMQSGIIKIVPPAEWRAAQKPLHELVKHIKIKNPITQEFHGAQGIYTQRNMERLRTYNLPQWKSICEQTENQPPAKRGEKRLNADKLLGRGTARKNKVETTPQPENGTSRARPSTTKRGATAGPDADMTAAPPTPVSPEVSPIVVIKQEEDHDVPSTRSATPTRGRGGRRGKGGKGRGVKREPTAKNTETTVAARRLRNAREVNDVVDEEAFRDFDYRVHDNDQWTQERCDELEDKYWKSLNFSNPMYAADMPGSLFDEDTQCWNVAKLPNLLDWLGAPIPGVNTAYLYLGMWRATFAWHLEDVDLYSINYIHFGAPKQWYSISQKDAPKFENAMKSLWPQDAKDCDQFLRHKTYLVSPSLLKSKFGVTVNKIVHREGEFVVTYPIGYHSGYNLGYNCAESVNFAIENWLQYGKTARKCQCESDSVFIDVDWFVRRMNGEPSPEYEEVEITDDDDDDHGMNTPAPSDAGRRKSNKRKRTSKDVAPNKKARKLVRIRKISRNQPCVLCPNDFTWEELLPTSHGQRAHRVCAMYTPETYIASEDGVETVHNVENISKARLELRCHECKQKKGSCFQCSSAKCTRAYHATCAMYAGVQVDKGDIAVWHEGIEYRDVGFDWRCKLHRTIKRHRITSESSLLNHALSWLSNRELHDHIIALQPGDVIQWQAVSGDEIQAGLVVSPYDHGQNSLLVSVLPDQKTVREVDPAWLLFVDSSTSCLQRPSPNALTLPEELQGKTAQAPGGTEKKPSEGDPFTEDPKTEWAEFVVEDPPHNRWQKPVDWTKEKQIWYFLGKSSTDSKAQYTADPARPVHDPASNFLDTVEPPKMPPPQPKRHSLAAPYPMMPFAVRNATLQTMRPLSVGPQRTAMLPKPDWRSPMPAEYGRAGAKPSQHHDQVAVAEAKANVDARVAQRHTTVAANTNGVGIDQAAVARQKQFQHQAAQQSKNMTGPQYGHGNPSTLLGSDDGLAGYRYPYTPQNYYPGGTNQSFSHNFYRPHSLHTTDWLHPPGQPQAGFHPIPSPAMPMMETNSPVLTFNKPATMTQSPTNMSTTTFPPDANPNDHGNTPQNTGYPFLGVSAAGSHVSSGTSSTDAATTTTTTTNSLKRSARSMEGRHSRTTSLIPPRTPMERERQRRISNPCYPFKSPQQIVASKEEQERYGGSQSSGGRTVSRPGSGYATTAFPSPVSHAVPFGPASEPMMYINPTATQLSSPISAPVTSHARAKSASMSAGVNNMGPPIHPSMPPFRRSLSSNSLAPVDSGLKSMVGIKFKQEPDFSTSSIIPDNVQAHTSPLSINFTPMLPPGSNRSRRSTLGTSTHPSLLSNMSSISMSSPLLAAHFSPAPIASPSAQLEHTLAPRPLTRSGTPTNDRPLPPVLVDWQSHPGFWGKVATYFGHKHENAATVYKSPFAATNSSHMTMHGASGIGQDDGLAGRWLDRLEGGQRLDLGMWLGSHPMGMRP